MSYSKLSKSINAEIQKNVIDMFKLIDMRLKQKKQKLLKFLSQIDPENEQHITLKQRFENELREIEQKINSLPIKVGRSIKITNMKFADISEMKKDLNNTLKKTNVESPRDFALGYQLGWQAGRQSDANTVKKLQDEIMQLKKRK